MWQSCHPQKLSAVPTRHRRICSWCHADLGPLWPDSQAPSYGICPRCVRRYFPDLYEPEEPSPEIVQTIPASQDTGDPSDGKVTGGSR